MESQGLFLFIYILLVIANHNNHTVPGSPRIPVKQKLRLEPPFGFQAGASVAGRIMSVPQHLMFSSFNILRMASNVVMRVGTKGRRSLFSTIPMAFSMALTPAGLPSTKRSLKSSANL